MKVKFKQIVLLHCFLAVRDVWSVTLLCSSAREAQAGKEHAA